MSLSSILIPIQKELLKVEDILKGAVSSETPLVTDAAKYVLENGGKRIRPALVLLSSKMLGACDEAAIKLGAAIEMIHAASLMHDDVLDNAKVRRGRASANVKWGNQISILVGDFLWCRASGLVISECNGKILSALTRATEKTTEGEIEEIVRANDLNITEEEYLKIIRLKTAELFSCACESGAIVAGASEPFALAMKNFGINLGMAFQLADDILDYTANETKFGKKCGTDLCEGRMTLPIILALKKCSETERKIIKEALLSESIDEIKLNEIIQILKRLGTIEESLKRAKEFANNAKAELIPFRQSIEKTSLETIADYAIGRGE